jgi:hypothetical protein
MILNSRLELTNKVNVYTFTYRTTNATDCSGNNKQSTKPFRGVLKTADVIQTIDFWKVVVHLNLTPYEEAVTTLREDLTVVQEATRHSSRLDEVHLVQIALEALEGKLENLKEFLPKTDRRRGLLDIGMAALRVLFDVATVVDLSGLHDTVNTLCQR